MNVLIVDESKKRTVQIAEAMQKNKNTVTCCRSSNEFLTKITGAVPGRIFIDVASWNNGKAIYTYFDAGKRLAEVPVVFYNAPQDFQGIKDRPKHGQDQVLTDPTPVETVIDLIKSLV